MTYIYALAEPETGEIRYVGKSTNPKNRISSHMSDAAPYRMRHWALQLRSRSQRPKLVILREVADGEDPLAVEREEIVRHSTGRLLNYCGVPNARKLRYSHDDPVILELAAHEPRLRRFRAAREKRAA